MGKYNMRYCQALLPILILGSGCSSSSAEKKAYEAMLLSSASLPAHNEFSSQTRVLKLSDSSVQFTLKLSYNAVGEGKNGCATLRVEDAQLAPPAIVCKAGEAGEYLLRSDAERRTFRWETGQLEGMGNGVGVKLACVAEGKKMTVKYQVSVNDPENMGPYQMSGSQSVE